MEDVADERNLEEALKKVCANRGSPGEDGMTVQQLPEHYKSHKLQIRESLLSGEYKPSPVLRREIPKPGGGVRMLGIPTVMDRLIQQAVLQRIDPIFDATFSEFSYGFRPRRSAHQAVLQAKVYIQEGHAWVVDMDIEKFFDHVQHDILMSRVSRRIGDKRILQLIGRFLRAGVMVEGVVITNEEGTPQGGPLSPLLANILLDDLDQELEKRGH
ncbi:MAG: group II intron reverse transcriptase/maturase, partial [Patescibacteria group bacterium]